MPSFKKGARCIPTLKIGAGHIPYLFWARARASDLFHGGHDFVVMLEQTSGLAFENSEPKMAERLGPCIIADAMQTFHRVDCTRPRLGGLYGPRNRSEILRRKC